MRFSQSPEDEPEGPPRLHVQRVPSVETDRKALGRFIDEGTASEAEIEYYEAFSDPKARDLNRDQRVRTGQFLRRVRRRARDQQHPDGH